MQLSAMFAWTDACLCTQPGWQYTTLAVSLGCLIFITLSPLKPAPAISPVPWIGRALACVSNAGTCCLSWHAQVAAQLTRTRYVAPTPCPQDHAPPALEPV